MDKEVLLHVKGLQIMEENEEDSPIELIVGGQYYLKNGSHYLRYEERMEDFPEQTTINYIKVSENNVEVRKKGLVDVHMVFERGKKNLTYYTTPFGTMQMGISTTAIDVKKSEKELDVKVEYALEMGGEHMADCYLSIRAMSKSECANMFD